MGAQPFRCERAYRHEGQSRFGGLLDGRPHELGPYPPSTQLVGHTGVHEHEPSVLRLVDELGLEAVFCHNETVLRGPFHHSESLSVESSLIPLRQLNPRHRCESIDDMTGDVFDLSDTHVHLGAGSRVIPIPGWEWSKEFLDRYEDRYRSEGGEGRLVMVGSQESSWTSWERHPAGDELLVVLSGKMTLVRETRGGHERVKVSAGEAAVNPRGVWHTADIEEAVTALFITPGIGTEHKPRR